MKSQHIFFYCQDNLECCWKLEYVNYGERKKSNNIKYSEISKSRNIINTLCKTLQLEANCNVILCGLLLILWNATAFYEIKCEFYSVCGKSTLADICKVHFVARDLLDSMLYNVENWYYIYIFHTWDKPDAVKFALNQFLCDFV